MKRVLVSSSICDYLCTVLTVTTFCSHTRVKQSVTLSQGASQTQSDCELACITSCCVQHRLSSHSCICTPVHHCCPH